VLDRANRRIQVFDENGKFVDQWSFGPVSIGYTLYIGADGKIWATDSKTWKLLNFDQEGHFLYSWGSQGDWPGAMWGAHGMSVDQEDNLYLAEVSNGRFQKFRPRKGANPAFLVSRPVRAAWKE
jgi:streptogramin lyase